MQSQCRFYRFLFCSSALVAGRAFNLGATRRKLSGDLAARASLRAMMEGLKVAALMLPPILVAGGSLDSNQNKQTDSNSACPHTT